MDLDHKIRGQTLDDLMADMDEMTYEKKVKPLLTITISAGGGVDSPEEEAAEMVDDSNMDPRLAKILRGKMG